MAIDEKTIYVYDDFSYNAPALLGMPSKTLWYFPWTD